MVEETYCGSFIAGCHRSGTTLLRYLLDSHPSIACPPESKFLRGLHAFYQYPQVLKGLDSMGFDRGAVLRLLRQVADGVFRGYTARQRKAHWVDKTPNYVNILPFIDELFNQMPRYIIVIRHPFDCVLSLQSFFGSPEAPNDDPMIRSVVMNYGTHLSAWAKYWRDAAEELRTFESVHPQRCFVLRYEDLVRRPEGCLSDVLDFIGVARGDGDAAKMCTDAFRMKHAAGYQDCKILQTRDIHGNSIYRWHDWTISERHAYWLIVGKAAEAYGYNAYSSEVSAPRGLPAVMHDCRVAETGP